MNPLILNCIAVDDEPLALGLVCAFVEQTPFLKLVGRYSSAIEALKGIHGTAVDLIFLDIQMPDLNGLELARILDHDRTRPAPRVVFTTAYNQYAIEGYKVDALDYLLKPFGYDEFLRAATKARTYAERITEPSPAPLPLPVQEPEEEYLFIKVEYQLVRIALKDILYLEGLKDYVKVHVQGHPKPILTLNSLKALEEKLPARRFMRIHRSYIVSLEQIKALTRNSVQISNVTLTVSDQYKDAFNQFFSRWTS
jgi:two-component system, LytTR family, response regulator LytT